MEEIKISLKELTGILLKSKGIKSGKYKVAFGYRFGPGHLKSPNTDWPIVGLTIGVEDIGLLRMPDDSEGPDVIDAAAFLKDIKSTKAVKQEKN